MRYFFSGADSANSQLGVGNSPAYEHATVKIVLIGFLSVSMEALDGILHRSPRLIMVDRCIDTPFVGRSERSKILLNPGDDTAISPDVMVSQLLFQIVPSLVFVHVGEISVAIVDNVGDAVTTTLRWIKVELRKGKRGDSAVAKSHASGRCREID